MRFLIVLYLVPFLLFTWVSFYGSKDRQNHSIKAWVIRVLWPLAIAFGLIMGIYYFFTDIDPEEEES